MSRTPQAPEPEWSDGEYPTDAALQRIREWKVTQEREFRDLLAFVRSIWKYADVGYWSQEEKPMDPDRITHRAPYTEYRISTGGWSGNESLIDALRDTSLFWSMCWVQSRRGGHYIFEVRDR